MMKLASADIDRIAARIAARLHPRQVLVFGSYSNGRATEESRLFEIVKPQVAFDIDMVLMETLDKLYIDARYPADFCLLPRGRATEADAKRFWDYAKGIYDELRRELNRRPEE